MKYIPILCAAIMLGSVFTGMWLLARPSPPGSQKIRIFIEQCDPAKVQIICQNGPREVNQ